MSIPKQNPKVGEGGSGIGDETGQRYLPPIVIAPDSVPETLISSLNALLRVASAAEDVAPVVDDRAASNERRVVSVSIANEEIASEVDPALFEEQRLSDRTAQYRAKGVSLVQQVLTGANLPCDLPEGIGASEDTRQTPTSASGAKEAVVFEPIGDAHGIGDRSLGDRSLGEPVEGRKLVQGGELDALLNPEPSVALDCLEQLEIAELTLDELLKQEDAPKLVASAVDELIAEKVSGDCETLGDLLAGDLLAGATPEAAAAGVSPSSPLDFDDLYLRISGTRNRVEATARMVEWFAKSLPGTSVRCGLGSSRLRRFFDARLGWLGSESSLQRSMAGQWRAQLLDGAKSEGVPGHAMIRLSREGRSQLALLTLEGDAVTESVFVALQIHERALAAVFWGRPRLALPEWSETRGRPRIAMFVAALMVVLLLVCPVPYPAACTVRVEPVDARVISSPFEATLESVEIEPGDQVEEGQLLVVLDGRPLRLEQQGIDAEIQQAAKQQDVAMAAGRIAEGQLAGLKVQQLQRRRDLLQRRLGQLNITSPISGIVVTGDLRRSIGAPLETGQVLFEIAPLDRVLLEIEIPEREIGLVNEDSPVQLRVESARTGNVTSMLTRIYPSAQLREDQSVFVAPIEMDNEGGHYRPGMRGKATVFGPVRPWAWRHIRGLVEQIAWLARW